MNIAQKLLVGAIAIFFSFLSVSGFAESLSSADNKTIKRSGFQVQRFKGGNTDSGTQGLMLGYRSSRYLYKGFSLGIEAVAGAPQDGSIVDNNVFYTGLTLGWDQSLFKILTYEIDVLLGYGYGKSDNLGVSGDGFTIQPQVGLGFVLVNGYRLSFLPGYLYMPRTNGFSGFTFSLRLDRKAETVPGKPVND